MRHVSFVGDKLKALNGLLIANNVLEQLWSVFLNPVPVSAKCDARHQLVLYFLLTQRSERAEPKVIVTKATHKSPRFL